MTLAKDQIKILSIFQSKAKFDLAVQIPQIFYLLRITDLHISLFLCTPLFFMRVTNIFLLLVEKKKKKN